MFSWLYTLPGTAAGRMQAAKGIKAPSLTVYLGNLDSKVTDRHLYELGCQVSCFWYAEA